MARRGSTGQHWMHHCGEVGRDSGSTQTEVTLKFRGALGSVPRSFPEL
jgi:hypothetical protein